MITIESNEVVYEIRNQDGFIQSKYEDLSIARTIIGWRREEAQNSNSGETFQIYKVVINREVMEGF